MTTNRESLNRQATDPQRRPVALSTIARKSSEPGPSRTNALRQRAGNQAVQRLIQAKLTVSEPGDAHEREADRVADAVMRMPANELADRSVVAATLPQEKVQQMCTDCEEEQKHKVSPQVQRKEQAADTPSLTSRAAANIQSLRGGGTPLPPATRAFFEPRFGASFSNVRVHTGARAEEAATSIGAKAFTLGNEIAFGSGQYSPASREGQKLLAHELTHTLQQRAASSAPVIARKDAKARTDVVDPLEDILPKGLGLVAVIDRARQLQEIFGPKLDEFVRNVRADAAAKAFTRQHGALGLIALVDTRGPSGFNVPAARKALAEDEKRTEANRLYTRARLDPRAETGQSFMFQKKPPEKKPGAKDEIESTAARLRDVVVDPTPIAVTVAGLKVNLEFSFLRTDVGRDGVPTGNALRGRNLLVATVTKMLMDLDALPPAPSLAARREDERTRARLKEAMRGLTTKPLRFFVSTAESEVLTGLSFRTEEVFVRAADIGDPSKLEAAVRVPVVALLGSQGFSDALTADELGESVLHEAVHALLIRRHVSANQLWDKLRSNLVEGPPTLKNRAEEVVHLYLLAQEEIWVYDEVQKLGAGYQTFAPVNRPHYKQFVKQADAFFKMHGVAFETVKEKLEVKEKVANSKVDLSITFHHPRKLVVEGTDLTPLNQLVMAFRG